MTLQEIMAQREAARKNRAQVREAKDSLLDKVEAEKREFTAEEKVAYAKYNREIEKYNQDIREADENITALSREQAKPVDVDAQMREFLSSSRKGNREITFDPQSGQFGQIQDSGAINLTIKELVPNFEEGTVLPSNFNLVGGVDGAVLIPTEVDDLEMEEAGEIEVLNDQTIDFDNVTVSPKRITLSVDISNKAIDNKALPIMPVVMKKIQKAWRKYWAKKYYSQANWNGVKGYFAGATADGTLTIGPSFAKDLLAKIAEFTDKGLDDSAVCLTIDAVTEAALKVTPIDPSGKNAGYVCQGGKILGYEYTRSHYINTELDSSNKLVRTADRYLGIGYYDFLRPQQHGEIRLTTDGTSKAMAKKNCVNVTYNTEVSLTSLSGKVYDEEGQAVKTYALFKLA